MFTSLLTLLIATVATATEIKVTADQPLRARHALRQVTTFNLENSIGSLSIVPIDGGEIELEGKTESKEPITVTFDEVRPGQFKLSVDYPQSTVTSQNSGDFVIGRGTVIGSVIIGGIHVSGSSRSGTTITVGAQPLHLRLGLPRTLLAHLKMDSRSGDISSKGAFPGPLERERTVHLSSGSGSVVCDELCAAGDFVIETSSADVEMARATATIARVTSGSGRVKLDRVTADLHVDTSSGDVTSRDGVGPLTLKTGSGRVELEDAGRAALRVRTSSGDVTARGGAGDTTIVTSSGRLNIAERGQGATNVKSSSGDIKLAEVCGSVNVETSSGRVKIKQCPDGPMEIETRSGDVTIGDSAGDVKIESSSGGVEVEGHAHGRVSANTRSGDIKFANGPAVVESGNSRSGRVRLSRTIDCNDKLGAKRKPGIFDF